MSDTIKNDLCSVTVEKQVALFEKLFAATADLSWILRMFIKYVALSSFLIAGSVSASEWAGVQVLFDESQALSLNQVREMEFSAVDRSNFGYTTSAVWIRKVLTASEAGTLWAVIHYPRIPQLDFYIVYPGGRIRHDRSGLEAPSSERAVSVRDYVFPFEVKHGEEVELYIRATSPVSIQLPLRIWNPDTYVEWKVREELFFGFAMAYMLALALAGLILAVTLKVRAAAIQAVAILTHVLVIYCFMGYAGWLGFPKGHFFNFSGIPFLAQMSMAVSLIYFYDVMDFKNRWPRVSLVFRAFVFAECILIATLAFSQTVLLIRIHLWFLIAAYLLMLITSAASAFQGFRPAYYFLAGWLVLIVSLLTQQLHYLGLIKAPWSLNMNLLQMLACVGSTFFVLAVFERVRMVRQERDSAQDALLQQSQEEAKRLQSRVAERTAELRQAVNDSEAANEAKSWFIANVSHDLRAPISSLISLSAILEHHSRELELPEKFRNFVKQTHSGAESLMLMLNNILDVSALEMDAAAIRTEPFELQEWSREMLDLIRALGVPRGIQVEFVGVSARVTTDRTRLSQILLNLAQNAIKFSPENGTVRIEILVQHEELRLTVSDSGPGILEEDRERVFELFSQAENGVSSHSGVGLGLNIVKRNVDLLGGSIAVESAKQVGTFMSVQIPIVLR